MAPKWKRINEEIRADKVQVISNTGEQLGVMTLSEALAIAEEGSMDLVEIGAQEWVVLTKIMDYGKFLFKQQKSIAQGKVHSKKADVKTIKLTYKIGDHDIDIRRNQAKKFGETGHPLKIMMTLRGRENQYETLALQKISEFMNSLADVYKVEWKVTRTGNNFSILLYPKK